MRELVARSGAVIAVVLSLAVAHGQEVVLTKRPPDPHGAPRPARDARDVPLKTSLYFELEMSPPTASDEVDPASVEVVLAPEGGDALRLLEKGRAFGQGASGWLKPKSDLGGKKALAIYVETGRSLRPSTRHEVAVEARSRGGKAMKGGWAFTTEADPKVQSLTFPIDLRSAPVRWRGAFFSGVCNVTFSSREAQYGATYRLMTEAHREHPRAWSYQRDFWTTGTDFTKPGLLPQGLPNVVREVETRRISKIEPKEGQTVLHVEDVFGHEQYGVPAGRRVSDDYHTGDEVLIADGVHDARVKVVGADDVAGTVTVETLPTPDGGWKVEYGAPLPSKEDPDAPGLFPAGGCYLRKFRPHGTLCYYWGRLDKEYDLLHRKGGRRLMVNFADATGDLARDGRSWTTAKDLAQWHEAARALTLHLIDRYGDDALTFTWSVFNEPDLGPLFWRADWDELQRFYDYAVDGILRAFEDRGYDSSKVFVGGLELGGIFGTNLRLEDFLAHCSPRGTAKGALPLNAAFADRRLDGKRSRRVEDLCRAHAGKGSPCDFVSIHSYNNSALMAAKLAKAKEVALAIDAEYYQGLWVNSHESCPDWMPPPDEAAADSYMGNGYFPTWCVDVIARQLRRAEIDPRFGFGETILTVWPPPDDLAGINAVTRVIRRDDGGSTTVPMPVFHALTLMSDLRDRFHLLPERRVGGHVVSGFASAEERGVRAILYAHNSEDTQSRSDAEFDVTLELPSLPWTGETRVTEYRFDRDHNSPFRLARALRSRPAPEADPDRVATLSRMLGGTDSDEQLRALDELKRLPAEARALLPSVMKLAQDAREAPVQEAARAALTASFKPASYQAKDVEKIQALTECRSTTTSTVRTSPGGGLKLTARVTGNGINFVRIEPAP
jgi:hypothetical protein